MAENQLPKGWVETTLPEICSELHQGVNTTGEKIVYHEDGFPVLQAKNITSGFLDSKNVRYINAETYVKYALNHQPNKDDILLTNIGTIGKSLIFNSEEDLIIAWNIFLIRVYSDYVTPKIINYYIKLLDSNKTLESLASGVATRFINKKNLSKISFPLPPLAEQQRIVAKLDKLFAHLEETKTRLNKIPQLLKNFRQSVLTQAVTGKLTEDWRKENEINKDTWESTLLDDLILFSGNGLSKRSGSGTLQTVLRLADFKNAKRVSGKERSINLTEKEKEKYTLNQDDILIVRVNGSVEIAGIFIKYEYKNHEAYCDHFIRLCLDKEKVNPDYLIYLANSGEGRIYLKNSLSTSAGQNTINQKSVKGLRISLPSLKEQNEILKIVQSLFIKADGVELKMNTLKLKIKNLPQSILAKAFKGELVEQLPTDGDAQELLHEIQKLKAQTTNTKKKKK